MQFRRTEDGIECIACGRRGALIRKRPGSARPWLVYRIKRSLSGVETEGGADNFRTLDEAKEFASRMFSDAPNGTAEQRLAWYSARNLLRA